MEVNGPNISVASLGNTQSLLLFVVVCCGIDTLGHCPHVNTICILL